MPDLPTEDDPDEIPRHQLPEKACRLGARWSANGFVWETVGVGDSTIHAIVIEGDD